MLLTAGVPAVGDQTIKGGGVMSRVRIRVTLFTALAALAATATVAAGASAAVPSKVTALGDSITQAFQTCTQAFTDCPENSWATGTSSTVKSIFFRIKEKNSKATETNRSVSGAKVGSLNEQAQKAVSDKAEFVTILIGANDACANPSTSQLSFTSSFQAAINTLESGLPGVRIYVGSIPNLFHLWEVFHTNSTATSSWELTKECPGIMTEPTSEGTAAKARRAATLAAEEGYDATMASICKASANCQWDNGTFFNGKFEPSEVSTNDYFHPSIAGQATLAAAAFSIAFCTAEGFCSNLESYESSEDALAPTAVAVEASSGDFWVAEGSRNRVVQFNPERKYVRQFGSAGTGNGQFQGVGAIATNAAGDVYAIDSGNRRVQEFSPEGKYITQWPAPGASAIAVDAEGNVWLYQLAALGSGPISEYSSAGSLKKQLGTSGSAQGQLGIAYGMAFSGGHLYVAELNRVQEFSTSGELLSVFDEQGSGAGQSNLPRGIAVNPANGNLYVSEVGANRVQIFSPAGAFISAFGSPGSGAGQFSDPQGIAAAARGAWSMSQTPATRACRMGAGELGAREGRLRQPLDATNGQTADTWAKRKAPSSGAFPMRPSGLEPPRANAHKALNLARLPIPPRAQRARV